ncbi:ABC transporter, ATP-binding protein [[Actinomadura] parvosata subsp. kistnae]|uniref:ABC transporter ATP-binding protein n=1 Tax=[Actinomadura] parvosata TaxID=1955412 RepID=UPI000D2980A4|nr:ABC transporter ATP-binding protein [Nonomuraea sp. ATCC 55076]SPL91191.1 ABC transporter, ATP-binding protein [Actinomadura parvosata subsp. kistnae]
MPRAEILKCQNLRKTFGDLVAVDDVSFTIEAGETYGLLGPNGAGKTTTISMIAGILERDGGQVLISGRPHGTTSRWGKKQIGYVPQDLALYPDLSARENLRFFARLHGLGRAEARARIDEVLRMIGLTERAKDPVKEYSGGMKRRLNIGVGLLHRPPLLILDEPTAGVDPQSRNAILESVAALAGEGVAVLYTTHYMEEAERLCDRIGIIDLGRIRAEGTRRELVGLVGELDRISLTTGGAQAVPKELETLPEVRKAGSHEGRLEVMVEDARKSLPRVLAAATDAGVVVRAVEVHEPNLESVFLHLTGKALRD